LNTSNLLSVEQCIQSLLDKAKCLAKAETVDLLSAKNRVIATDVQSTINVPPADNSAMDGYVINTADYQTGDVLKISQRIQAGERGRALEAGTAARIFTGAEIPDNANTVVIQENAEEKDDYVSFTTHVAANKNIRLCGQDIAVNDIVIEQGTRLRPQEIGLLGSIGVSEVKVFKELTVGLLNTGDELVEPGNPLGEGKIYNSNKFLVDSLLSDWGFKVLHAKPAKDSLEETKAKLSELAESCDIIITTGGVSVGDEDHVNRAISELGELTVSRINIKPGKPFGFGSVIGKPFLGLPGNPASTFVTLLILARPYLLCSQGRKASDLNIKPIKIKADLNRKAVKREEYIRARLLNGKLDMYQNQSSGVLSSAAWGNCLLRQTTGQEITSETMLDV